MWPLDHVTIEGVAIDHVTIEGVALDHVTIEGVVSHGMSETSHVTLENAIVVSM